MFDNIKRLKKLNKEVNEVRDVDMSPENDCLLTVFLNSTEDALSPFCDENSPVINSDLADYLDNKAEQLPLDKDIHIKINGEADKDAVKKAIRNYYDNRLISAKREYKKNAFVSGLFTLFAVIILTVAVIIETCFSSHLVLFEIIDIVGWVFMWEAADMFFLERGSLRIKQIRYLNFIKAKVE